MVVVLILLLFVLIISFVCLLSLFHYPTSQPVVGHFNDDEVPDILVILEDPVLTLLNQSLVQILDGQNGNIIWSRKLRLAKNTTPLSANVGYKNDVFLLWIEKETKVAYRKTFLSKAGKHSQVNRRRIVKEGNLKVETLNKAASFDSENALHENVSGDFIEQQKTRHDRSPRSVESHVKTATSVSDMEDELDSLVDEIFVKDFGNAPATASQKKSSMKTGRKRKKIENTHKILQDILKQVDEPSIVNEKESRFDGGRSKTTDNSKLTTERPVFYDFRAFHNKPSIRTRQRGRQIKTSSHNDRNDDRKPTGSTLTTQPSAFYSVQIFRSQPSRKVKDKQTVKQMAINSADIQHIPSRKQTSTVNVEILLPAETTHSLMNNKPRITTNKPKVANLLNDKVDLKITKKEHTVFTTNKPVTKLPQMKRIEQFVVNSPGKESDRGKSKTVTPVTGNHLQDQGQNPTNTLPTEHSLKANNELHDIEQKQNSAMANKKATINKADSDGNNRSQSPTGAFHGSIYSKPTTKIVQLENNKMQTRVGEIFNRGINDHTTQNPTATSLTMHHQSPQGEVKIITNKPTTETVNNGRVEDVTIKNPGKKSSNLGGGNFHKEKHMFHMLVSPTPPAEDRDQKKTNSDNTSNDKINDKTTEQSLPSDVKSLPGRVQAPHPGFSISHNDTKIANAASAILDSSLVHSDHHTAHITVEEVTDTKDENTDSSIRSGKDIIVMQTNSSIVEQPTEKNGQKLAEQKEQRQINSNTQTATQKQQQHKNTEKRFSKGNEHSHSSHVPMTDATSSRKAHNSSEVVPNLQPTTRPRLSSESPHGKTALKPSTARKDSNPSSTVHGNPKKNIKNGIKNSDIFNPVKPNRTERLDESKVSFSSLNASFNQSGLILEGGNG